MKSILPNFFSKFVAIILVATAVIAPFSQFIETQVGGKEALRASKDILVYVALLFLFFYAKRKKSHDLKALLGSKLNQLVVAYGALNTVYIFVGSASVQSRMAGLLFNTRFLVWFALLQLIYVLFGENIHRNYRRIFEWIGMGLVIFALIQIFILPADFFSFLGYEYSSGLSYQTVDNDPNLPRFSATTRGPNELGAFLVIYSSWLCFKLIKNKTKEFKRLGIILASIIALYFTYSRSAALGLVVSVALMSLNVFSKKQILFVCVAAALLAAGTLLTINQSQTLQRIVFHDENNSEQVDSNERRLIEFSEAIEEISDQPLGYGLGSSGPASFYGEEPSVPDNYYLQIAIEIGVLGLTLFISIVVLLLLNLRQHDSVLFASGVALSVIAFFNHLWADDLIAYTWWGLVAFSIASSRHKLLSSAS